MAHQAIEAPVVPAWLSRTILGTIVTLLLTGAAAVVASSLNHETRITVVEEHDKAVDKSLDEIKAMQREQMQDMKEILRRLPRRQ